MRFVAGRGAVAELLAEGAAAKSHREVVGGRALRLSGWLAGAPWRKQLAGRRGKETSDAMAESHREEVANQRHRSGKDAAGRGAGCQVPYSAEVPRTKGFPAEVQLLKPPASSITL